MDTFRQLCCAAILSLALGVSSFAGDMQTPGIISSDSTQGSRAKALPVVKLALGFLLNVSSLF
jgi:hypothetical protein